MRRRGPGRPCKPLLTVEQVLAWADAYKSRTGQWPQMHSGSVPEAPGESWAGINKALSDGRRGLPESSLARLLSEYRGASRRARTPRRQLTIDQVLAWADAWKERMGKWPSVRSGTIPEASGLNWRALDQALRQGSNGLPGGSSLALLLHAQRKLPGRTHHPSPAPDTSRNQLGCRTKERA